MEVKIRSEQIGFTLVETLIAMVLATAFLVPLSTWLYKNHVNQRALNRFCALSLLETELHRAFLQREEKTIFKEYEVPCRCRVEIEPELIGDEVKLSGKVLGLSGPPLGRMTISYFGRKSPLVPKTSTWKSSL